MDLKNITKDLKNQTDYRLKQRFGELMRRNPSYKNLDADNQKLVYDLIKKYQQKLRDHAYPSSLTIRKDIYNLYQKRIKLGLTYTDRGQIKGLLKSLKYGMSQGSDKVPGADEKPVKVRINRDPNNNMDFGALKKDIRPGLTPRANRAVSVAQTKRPGLSSQRSEPVRFASIAQANQGRTVVGVSQLKKPGASDRGVVQPGASSSLKPGL